MVKGAVVEDLMVHVAWDGLSGLSLVDAGLAVYVPVDELESLFVIGPDGNVQSVRELDTGTSNVTTEDGDYVNDAYPDSVITFPQPTYPMNKFDYIEWLRQDYGEGY